MMIFRKKNKNEFKKKPLTEAETEQLIIDAKKLSRKRNANETWVYADRSVETYFVLARLVWAIRQDFINWAVMMGSKRPDGCLYAHIRNKCEITGRKCDFCDCMNCPIGSVVLTKIGEEEAQYYV